MSIAGHDPHFLEHVSRRERAHQRRQMALNTSLVALAAATMSLVYAALVR
jgi:hypothetical protein